MTVKFDAATHTYTNEYGKTLISVTQLLRKHSITPDFSKVNKDLLEFKAQRGTMIHKEIEDWLCGGDEGFTSEFEYFRDNIAPMFKFARPEEILFTNDYAGTTDLLAVDVDRSLWIVDYKTGQVHKEAVRWQLSLYKYAFLFMRAQGVYWADLPYDPEKPIKLAVFDAKETGSKFYEVEEIPVKQIDELLRCEFDEETIYGTTTQLDASLVQKALVFEQAIASLDAEKKRIDTEYKNIKAQIQAAMTENGVKTYETDNIRITVKSAYERTTVDSKKLQEKFPEVYEACAKKSKVAESLSITIKEAAE